MRKGIAKQFVERFGRVDEIRDQGVKVGGVAVLRHKERYIYNLVTKEKYFEKPTMTTLRNSLTEMQKHMQKKGVEGVAMPRIGCGLDLLQWRQVKQLLEEVFKNSESNIVVYTREEDQMREQHSMETFLSRDRDRDRKRDRDHDRTAGSRSGAAAAVGDDRDGADAADNHARVRLSLEPDRRRLLPRGS